MNVFTSQGLLLAALFCWFGGWFGLAQAQCLLVSRDDSSPDTVLLALDLQLEPTWVLAWHHSVTGILVRDFYALHEGTMTLTQSHTPSFDAGLGHIPGRGRVVSDDHHGYWIKDINEPVVDNQYWLRVGSLLVDHRIIHAGKTYSLSTHAAGQRVRLSVVLPHEEEACQKALNPKK